MARNDDVFDGGFEGFGSESFDFFRHLARNNNKAWLDAHRAEYRRFVVGPLRSLCAVLAPKVLALSPGFEVSGRTGENLSRINRDLRFSRDKAPYRHNMYLFFAQRDRRRREARLYLNLTGDGVTCGFAIYHAPRGKMERLLKARRIERADEVERFARRLSRRYEIYWYGREQGRRRKHPGFPTTEREWKRMKGWVVRSVFPRSRPELRDPRFARKVAKIFEAVFPLYAFSGLEGLDHARALDRGVGP